MCAMEKLFQQKVQNTNLHNSTSLNPFSMKPVPKRSAQRGASFKTIAKQSKMHTVMHPFVRGFCARLLCLAFARCLCALALCTLMCAGNKLFYKIP